MGLKGSHAGWLAKMSFSEVAVVNHQDGVPSLLFRVSPLDPWTYSAATLCVMAIAWIACYLPSRRAATVNPVNALRAE